MKALTPKQQAFAHYVADGLTASEAYRRAYRASPNKTTTVRSASAVRNTPAVASFIKELQDEHREAKLAERTAKRRVLSQIMFDRDMDAARRLDAIKIDNAMTGDNAPVKVEGEITLGSILEKLRPTTGIPSDGRRP